MASWHSYLVWPDTSLMIHGKLHSGETLCLTGWGQGICSCHHSLMSWVLFMNTANQPATCLFLPDHMYPQQFLKKCKCCCVLVKAPSLSPLSCSLPFPSLAYYHFLLLPPALRARPIGCPYPPCCLHTGRQEQKGGPLLPLLEVRAFPLLQPGLTRCLQRKPVTERHRSLLEERCSPALGAAFWSCLFFCLQFTVHAYVCVGTHTEI